MFTMRYIDESHLYFDIRANFSEVAQFGLMLLGKVTKVHAEMSYYI